MKSLLILFDNIISLYIWVLIIHVIFSWLVAFNVLNTSNRFVYSILDISYKLTAPPLNFIRRFMPNLGAIDISPVILILGLILLFSVELIGVFGKGATRWINIFGFSLQPSELVKITIILALARIWL